MSLDFDKLSELEEKLQHIFSDELLSIVSTLNRKNQLEDFLEMIGHTELLQEHHSFSTYKTGKIIVVGYSDVKQTHLEGAAKELGFEKDRFEFYLDYEDGIDRKVKTWQWNLGIAMILVGPMPHSGEAKGSFSSVITAMESDKGFPKVVRLGTNGLKITKSDFSAKLKELIDANELSI